MVVIKSFLFYSNIPRSAIRREIWRTFLCLHYAGLCSEVTIIMRQLEVWKLLVERGKILDEVREKKADVLGLSALLTTTMPFMSRIIKTLDEVGLRSSVKVIVGGAPVTQDYANYIGADAYAHDGGKAVTVCKKLMGK